MAFLPNLHIATSKTGEVTQVRVFFVVSLSPKSNPFLISLQFFMFPFYSCQFAIAKRTSLWTAFPTSHRRDPRRPHLSNPLHLPDKPFIRNLLPPRPRRPCNHHRRPVIRPIERVLEQPDVRRLQRAERRLQIRVPQSDDRLLRRRGGRLGSLAAGHVDDDDEFDARVGEPAVAG